MKKLLYTSLLLACTYTVFAQTVPSSCNAPASIVQQYSDDADYIALQRIITLNDVHKDSITIPQVWADTALRAMLAVYNTHTLPARDSVINRYNIHEYGANFTLHSIFLTADTAQQYMKQMYLNIYPTGDTDFDNLGTKYPIKSWQYIFGVANFHNLTLYLDSAYNTPVLKDEYNILAGLQNAVGTLNMFGDSNHIEYSITPNYVELRYIHGWQNCMTANGCEKQHTWTFHVSYNCDVTYIGSSGDPLFPPVNTVSDLTATEYGIYPNPAGRVLHITAPVSGSIHYRILNNTGSTIFTGQDKDIDISGLPPGQYFIRLQDETHVHTSRFTKL